ncbi:MAG: acetylglutamate kinase [Opitutales bacterium]|nr:acetylglutamate kinase [Opitutales bacterium]
MEMITPTTKASVLIEALPYIQRFRDSIFVIKYGGSFMDDPDPEMRGRVATDVAFLASVGIRVVVVHGGGKAITRAMDAAGIEAEFVNGLRRTSAEAVSIVENTLNHSVNLDICNLIQAAKGKPIAIHGNRVLQCKRLTEDADGKAVDIGYVGEVTHVLTQPILYALDNGYTPVISPVAIDASGQPHNINADIAAAHVAKALHARRLVYMSDVPGLLRNPEEPATLISSLKINEVPQLKADGVISKGMVPKVDSAVDALEAGVHRVHLVDGRMPHSILLEIFTHTGIGTELVQA